MRYIGIDAHKEFCHVVELEEGGAIAESYQVSVNDEGLSALKARLESDDQVILEAGGNAFFLAEHLRPVVAAVTVVHPTKTRSIAASKMKTDKSSAETLARLLASGYTWPVWIPSIQVQTERALYIHRGMVVNARTAFKNRVHAILYRRGMTYPGSDLFKKKGQKFLSNSLEGLEELEKIQVLSLMKLVEALDAEIVLIDGHLAHLAKDREDVHLLMTIPGVSFLVAMGLLAEIGDVRRFPSPKHLASYAGIVSRVHQSGKTLRRGAITYTGRNNMRSLLFIAVLLLVRRQGRIQEFYERLLPKGKKVAFVACARKLLVIIWKMLIHNEPFRDSDPALNLRKAKSLTSSASRYPAGLSLKERPVSSNLP